MALGEVILQKGKAIAPADVGMMASLGMAFVKVFGKPKAAVMSTGDEVFDITNNNNETKKGKHQIFDANRPVLYSLAGRYCDEVVDLGIAGDTQERLESLFARAVENKVDVLVTSGGVSMGDSDLIKPILEKQGQVHFGKVKMKPGKPLTFATITQKEGEGEDPHKMFVFALPGNPVSSFVTFHLVVIPALRKLAGWPAPHLTRVFVRAAEDFVMDAKRPEYHRVTLSWDQPQPFGVIDGTLGCLTPNTSSLLPMAHSTGNQISSRLTSLRGAHALMEIPQGDGAIRKGSVLSALLINEINL
jgi:gephyrin